MTEKRGIHNLGVGFINPLDGAGDRTVARDAIGKSQPPASSARITRRQPKTDSRRQVQHLAFVRQLPCVVCGRVAPSEAAHVRTGTDGGTALKPSDRYAVPLCARCHAKQHRIGELTFWFTLRIDPLVVASRLWTVSTDLKAGERTVFRARHHVEFAKAYSE